MAYILTKDIFFELRRRAVCHFIKVEIKYTSLNRPYSSTKHHQHTPIHLTKTVAPQTKFLSTRQKPPALYPHGWLPDQEFLELSCSSTAPKIALKTSWMLGVAFSNTQELWCFHTSQATKIIRELSLAIVHKSYGASVQPWALTILSSTTILSYAQWTPPNLELTGREGPKEGY